MDRSEDHPLTAEEAKQRLRLVAKHAGPAGWVRERPWSAVALAFAAGLLAGAEPVARKPLAEAMALLIARGLNSVEGYY